MKEMTNRIKVLEYEYEKVKGYKDAQNKLEAMQVLMDAKEKEVGDLKDTIDKHEATIAKQQEEINTHLKEN